MSVPLAHLLTDSVTFQTVTGRGAGGDPTYGAQQTVDARVEDFLGTLRLPNGTEVSPENKIVTLVEIPRDSRIWLPGTSTGDNSEARELQRTAKASLPRGGTLYEAFL